MMTSRSLLAVGLATCLGLVGCSSHIRNASSSEIERLVSFDAHREQPAWLAPELQVQHYRQLFYGYDTVYYRLAKLDGVERNGDASVQLLIDAHYGGDRRHYDLAKEADGTTRKTKARDHQAERCQFFNNLVYSCLYRDRASLDLQRSELEQARRMGLTITLSSSNADYERIELPPAYIDGFLQATASNRHQPAMVR